MVGFFREGINHRSWIYAETIHGPFLGWGYGFSYITARKLIFLSGGTGTQA